MWIRWFCGCMTKDPVRYICTAAMKENYTHGHALCRGVSAVWAYKRITAQYVPTESCAMFWREFCPDHRIFCIEWWLYLHINSFHNAFAWLNAGFLWILVLCLIYSTCYQKAATIYFILGQYAKLFCQVITELFIFCACIGTQNKCRKYGMYFLATQMLSSLDGGSTLSPFCFIHIKIWRWSRWYGLTSRHFRLFVPVESVLIPPGSLYTNRSKIYLQKPKCLHTVYNGNFHSSVVSRKIGRAWRRWRPRVKMKVRCIC